MIRLTCTSCNRTLELDDAFAGGACRCQYCGTIQTVPAHLKTSGKPPVAQLVSTASTAPTLAEGVKSSSTAVRDNVGATADKRKRMILIAAGAAAGLIIGIIIIVVLAGGGGSKKSADQGQKPPAGRSGNLEQQGTGGGDASAVPSGQAQTPSSPPASAQNPPPNGADADIRSPNFMGVSLKGPSIVLLLDRGSGTVETFDYIKGGAMRCLQSLGPNMRFQIVFWETNGLLTAPKETLVPATKENIAATAEQLKDVVAMGQSKIEAALDLAISQNPAEIVIATGKFVDDTFVKAVIAGLRDKKIKVHTVCLDQPDSKPAMQSIAQKTGGTFIMLAGPDMTRYGEYAP